MHISVYVVNIMLQPINLLQWKHSNYKDFLTENIYLVQTIHSNNKFLHQGKLAVN